jgi:hypothetical protein
MKQIVILFVIFSIPSCGVKKNINKEEVQIVNKKESFALDMGMLIEFYTKTKMKTPTSSNDLISYIESMDEGSKLIYLRQYDYLKKNKEKLIFTTSVEINDSEILMTICIYYKKVIPSKGLFKAFVNLPIHTIEQKK